MIRFAWLQSRTQTFVVAAALAALAIAAAVTGVHLSHLYSDLVAPCTASGNCGLAIGEFTNHYNFLQGAFMLLLRLAPALIGIFWGGPLIARELETGTYRLAWTQSVTRSRWILTKLAIVGGTTVAVAGLLTLTITWWYRALDSIDGSNMYGVFDARDIAPIGYTFFAFMLGALLGAVIRRTLPAMAATLGVFVFARVAIQLWVRPHLLSPVHKTMSILTAKDFGFISSGGSPVQITARGASPPGSWELSSQLVTSSGHVATAAERAAFVQQYCPSIAAPPPFNGGGPNHPVKAPPGISHAFDVCQAQAAKTFHLVVSYQPASRYWTFQWLELGIFVVLGLIAAALCFWWVTRRVR
jgi:hypothetical protein